MNLNHEINSYMARVAFCMKVPRSSFTEEEVLYIEGAYAANESPADCAYLLEYERGKHAENPEALEDENS